MNASIPLSGKFYQNLSREWVINELLMPWAYLLFCRVFGKNKLIVFVLSSLSTLSANSQAPNSLVGNWQDEAHSEKKVEFYTGKDSKLYGKSVDNFIVFKSIILDEETKIYRGILVNPDNKEEFTINIRMPTKDTFTFVVRKFLFTKKFQFVRIR